MSRNVTRQIIRTNPVNFIAGQSQQIQLQQALSQNQLGADAMIEMAWFELLSNLETGAADGPGAARYQQCARFTLSDNWGEVCDISGNSMRYINMWETQERGTRDPAGAAAMTAAGNYGQIIPWRFLFPLDKVVQPSDYWIPLARWARNVQANWLWSGEDFGPANSWSINSGTVRIALLLRSNPDGSKGTMSDGTRLFVKEDALTSGQTQEALDVKGRARFLALAQGASAFNAGTQWETSSINITTMELLQAQQPAYLNRAWHDLQLVTTQTSNDTTLSVATTDPILEDYVIPLWESRLGAPLVECPLLDYINPQLSGGTFPNGGVFLRSVIRRQPNCGSRRGFIRKPNGVTVPLDSAAPPYRDFLPVQLPIATDGQGDCAPNNPRVLK